MRIPSGKTDQNIYFVAVDATDLKTRETALSSFTVYRSRNGAAEVQYTTPTVTEIDATNMPGVYALLVDEDTTIGASSDSEEYCVHITHAGMAPVTRTIELYRRDTTSGQTIDVSSGGVEVGAFQTGSITSAAFAAGAITATVIATDAIDADAIADNAINAASIAADTITAAKIADGAIDAATFAAGAINAAAIAADAITAAKVAADVSAEIADAVWDEDATGHQTGGTFGQAIGDPGADTNTIFAAVVTNATGATIAHDIVTIDGIVDDILLDTAEIGAAGAGLTAINLPDQTMNITGDITGNLSGSVGSVTGAVGSVTGNVGGNVTGTIGGLTAAALKDFFDTDSATTYASAVAGSVVKEIADNAGGSGLTAAAIADAVWDEATTGHVTAGTFGEQLKTDVDAILADTGTDGVVVASINANAITATAIAADAITAAKIADGAIDAATFAAGAINAAAIAADAITAAKVAADVTTELQNGLATAASITALDGKIDTIDNFLDTEVAAILADTNELQTDWADGGRLDLILDARASQTSVDTVDDFLDTEVAAIKAKTDSLTFTVAGKVDANSTHISGSSTAADNLEAGAIGLVLGTCAAGSTTTSVVTNLTEATDDHYNGRALTFTSGALLGQSTSISDYNGTTKTLTVVAITEAPAENDAFVIS